MGAAEQMTGHRTTNVTHGQKNNAKPSLKFKLRPTTKPQKHFSHTSVYGAEKRKLQRYKSIFYFHLIFKYEFICT